MLPRTLKKKAALGGLGGGDQLGILLDVERARLVLHGGGHGVVDFRKAPLACFQGAEEMPGEDPVALGGRGLGDLRGARGAENRDLRPQRRGRGHQHQGPGPAGQDAAAARAGKA